MRKKNSPRIKKNHGMRHVSGKTILVSRGGIQL